MTELDELRAKLSETQELLREGESLKARQLALIIKDGKEIAALKRDNELLRQDRDAAVKWQEEQNVEVAALKKRVAELESLLGELVAFPSCPSTSFPLMTPIPDEFIHRAWLAVI